MSDEGRRRLWAREKNEPRPSFSAPVVKPSFIDRSPTEQATWSHRERLAKFDAGPADWIKPLPATGAWSAVGSRLSDAEWREKHRPRVVFDSGWFDWEYGDPLPPIESFRCR